MLNARPFDGLGDTRRRDRSGPNEGAKIAGSQVWWGPIVQGIRERGEATSRAQLAVTGDDLRDAGVAPGPELGKLLGKLLDAVLEDPSLNEKQRLLELAGTWR